MNVLFDMDLGGDRVWYDINTRTLELAEFSLSRLTALVKYKDDNMLLLNKERALADIDCLMETLKSVQDDIVEM